MEWLDRLNGAIRYIEDHIMDEIDFETAARHVCCSVYQFQRMFSFIAGIPLSEYIRRRRLTLAGLELKASDVKVIDLAIKYGYDSPVSFARAFHKLHGVNPSSARESSVPLKAYPPISIHISIKGDAEMNYRIEEKPEIILFGVEKIISTENGENTKEIPEFWNQAFCDGTIDRIQQASGIKVDENFKGILPVNAVMCYRDTGKKTMPYMLCAFAPGKEIPEGFDSVTVPAGTWAIFATEEHTEDRTAEVIQALWKRIYTEWFPTSGYEPVPGGPEFEMYGIAESGLSYCEVWIMVQN
jgi:AraC family transcriptional regulator